MEKFIKGCLITVGIFIVTGLVIGLIVTLIGGRNFISLAREHEISRDWVWGWNWNWGRNELTVNDVIINDKQMDDTISSIGIKELDIAAGACEFILEEWDNEDFGIEISGRGDCNYYVDSGCLYVKGFNNVSGDASDNEIRLSIPHSITFEDISFDIGASSAEVSGITAGSLSCSVGMGDMSFAETSVDKVNMDVGMGNVEFEGLIAKELAASCGMGNMSLILEGKEDDYNYSINCAAGNIEIDGTSYSMLAGEKSIDNDADRDIQLDCGMGNVVIDFTD